MHRVLADVLFALLCLAPAAQAAVTPYGTDNVPGFRNVLPPGTTGVDNAFQLAAFEASGTLPAHWDDQQPLYDGLLYASPTLTHDEIAKYFKDATFGVKDDDVESHDHAARRASRSSATSSTASRTSTATRATTSMFGAGYAGAQDRLFLMDVLRHTGRAQLSSFVGGSAGNRAMDRTQWAIAPYTEADLQTQIDARRRRLRRATAQQLRQRPRRVRRRASTPTSPRRAPTRRKLPAEYAALGKTPEHWKRHRRDRRRRR